MSGFIVLAGLNIIVLSVVFLFCILCKEDAIRVVCFIHSLQPWPRQIICMVAIITLIMNLMVANVAFPETTDEVTHQEE